MDSGIITPTGEKKRIALVAHDNKKGDLLEWARFNRDLLAEHQVCSTGTTGALSGARARYPRHKASKRPAGRRPADRGQDSRRGDRLPHLFLGPPRAPPPRP